MTSDDNNITGAAFSWNLDVCVSLVLDVLHILSTFSNDIAVELLDNRKLYLVVCCYQLCSILLQVGVAFVNFFLGSPDCNYTALLVRIWEEDLHLVEFLPDFANVVAASANNVAVESVVNYDVT